MSSCDAPGQDEARRGSEAEGEYRRLLDRSLTPVCIHDGRVVHYVNPAAARALKAESDAEIVGRPITDHIDPASLDDVRERTAGLREDGDISEPCEVTLLCADGTTLAAHAVAALKMRHGEPTYEVIFRRRVPRRMVPAGDDTAAATAAIITTNRDGIVTGWDAGAHRLYGRSAGEVMGMRIERAVGADLDPGVLGRAGGREPATHHDAGGQALSVRVLVIATADGYVIVCETSGATVWTEDRFRAVLDLLHDGVVIVGSDGRFEFTNVAARRMLGSPAEDLVGVHHSSQGVDLPLYDAQGQRISTESHPIRWIQKTGLSLGGQVVGVDRIDGRRIWVMGHGCLMDPGDPQNSSVLFSFTDITEHHDARERLLHDATHDWLTGLPNRGYALDQAALALNEHGSRRLSAVLFIDLDRLKAVNDSHGHPIGDDVLRIAATRMQSVTRAQDLVARIGGDEFVVLLIGPVEGGGPEAIARRLHDVLAEDIVVGTLTLRIGASIGITTVGSDDERTLADVLRDADAAMYRAKSQGPAKTAHFEDEQPDGDR